MLTVDLLVLFCSQSRMGSLPGRLSSLDPLGRYPEDPYAEEGEEEGGEGPHRASGSGSGSGTPETAELQVGGGRRGRVPKG